VFKIP